MNWEFILKYLPMYEKAAWLTLRIGLLGIVFAIIVGFVCSTIQYYKVPVLRQIVAVYIELSRNTPLLVQLFFIYYGLPKIGIQTNAEACGVAGLAFLGGSYMAEAFRSGLGRRGAVSSCSTTKKALLQTGSRMDGSPKESLPACSGLRRHDGRRGTGRITSPERRSCRRCGRRPCSLRWRCRRGGWSRGCRPSFHRRRRGPESPCR